VTIESSLQRAIGALHKSMSPMDAFEWFQTPICTFFGALSGTPLQIAKANPQRVALIISSGSSTNIAPETAVLVAGGGIALNATLTTLVFIQAETGPLCQLGWWATNTALGNVTVVEVLLREWPGDRARPQRGG
jgi:hypothetical protein